MSAVAASSGDAIALGAGAFPALACHGAHGRREGITSAVEARAQCVGARMSRAAVWRTWPAKAEGLCGGEVHSACCRSRDVV